MTALLVLILLLLSAPGWATDGAVTTSGYQLDASTPSGHISVQNVLSYQAASRSLEDVRQIPLDIEDPEGWMPLTTAPPIQNRLHEPLWLHLRLRWNQPIDQPRLLALAWPFYTQTELYVCRPQCELHPPLPASRTGPTLAVQFELADVGDQELDVYLRLTTSGKVAIPLSIWTPEARRATDSWQLLLTGAYLGVLLVMMLYNLTISRLLRDKSYLWYSAYVGFTLLYAITINGVGRAFFWGDASWSKAPLIGLVVSFSMALTVQFFRSILNIAHWSSPYNWLTRGMSYLFVALGISQLGPFAAQVMHLWDFAALVNTPLLIVLGLIAWRRGNPTGLYLTIGWLMFSVASITTVLGLAGFYQVQGWHFAFQNVSIALETVLFSFALAERINRERRQREVAQGLAMQYLKDAAEAREQTLTIEREAKIRLEDQVEQRTRELRLAMAKLEMLNISLDTQSRIDSLTGLANRRHLDESLQQALLSAQTTQKPLVLLMGDIDHFKRLNDQHGHAAGDACLMMVAQVWQQVLQQHALVIARYGGEEFVALLSGCTLEQAGALAEQLRATLEAHPCPFEDKRLQVTQSIGVHRDQGTTTPDTVLKAVDKALYKAKHEGRNRVCYS